MSYNLSKEKKLQILSLYAEGLGIRAINRVTGAGKQTIAQLVRRAALAARRFSHEKLINLPIPFLEVDELWTFVQRRHGQCPAGKRGPMWIFVGIDPASKLALACLVGRRTGEFAKLFMETLKSRLAADCQISTDQLSAYVRAIEATNHAGVWSEQDHIYLAHARTIGPAELGRPQTNHVESHNGQLRNHISRLRRQGKGFSKTVRDLEDHLAIYFFYYNFIKRHLSLGQTPAQALGICAGRLNWAWLLSYGREQGFVRRRKVRRAPYGPRRVRPAEVVAA